jgi:hypothetical protein
MTTWKYQIVLGATLGLLAACGGSDPEDPPIVIPPTFGGDDDTADTAAGPQYNTVDQIRFIAYIAWDDVLEEVISPTIDEDDGFISAYIIRIGTSEYSSDNPDSYCDVTINLEGYVGAEDAQNDGYIWGLDVPQGETIDAVEDCVSRGWDPSEFEEDSPLYDWATYDYHLRLGGDPSADLTDWLTPDNPEPDFDINNYVGGTWWTDDAGLNGGDDDIYYYAYEMDPEGNVDFESRLDRYELTTPDAKLRTGYYVSRMSVYWNLADD